MDFIGESLLLSSNNKDIVVARTPLNREDIVLAKHVKGKVCSNGDTFTGHIDALTGEILCGTRIYKEAQESYEGTFLDGRRHGNGAVCTKLDGSAKFLGSFRNNMYEEGTLVVSKEYSYTGKFRRNKFHGKGILVLENGSVYKGQFVDGSFDGEGELTNPFGDKYNGNFCNGHKEGFGVMQYSDGSVYEGNWKEDAKHGEGKETLEGQKLVYKGAFESNKRHGRGIMTTPVMTAEGTWLNGLPVDGSMWKIFYPKKGIVYTGEALSYRPHGTGKLTVTDKDGEILYAYEGEFCCGLRHGTGQTIAPVEEETTEWTGDLKRKSDVEDSDHSQGDNSSCDAKGNKHSTFPLNTVVKQDGAGRTEDPLWSLTLFDGSLYSGFLHNGVPHGRGVLVDASNNSEYTGDFVDGAKEGNGEEKYPDGSCYRGSFFEGKRNGEGSLSQPNGYHVLETLYEGEWTDDAITGHGTLMKLLTPCPGVYVGRVEDGNRHGHGIFTGDNGYILEGEWSNDRPLDGDWVITFPKGSVYYGSATCNKKTGIPEANGFGTENMANGDFYSGTFVKGLRHGAGLCVFSTGEQWDGKWKDGIFVRYGKAKPGRG